MILTVFINSHFVLTTLDNWEPNSTCDADKIIMQADHSKKILVIYIILLWLPSHGMVHGNEKANYLVKQGAQWPQPKKYTIYC